MESRVSVLVPVVDGVRDGLRVVGSAEHDKQTTEDVWKVSRDSCMEHGVVHLEGGGKGRGGRGGRGGREGGREGGGGERTEGDIV